MDDGQRAHRSHLLLVLLPLRGSLASLIPKESCELIDCLALLCLCLQGLLQRLLKRANADAIACKFRSTNPQIATRATMPVETQQGTTHETGRQAAGLETGRTLRTA
jgi:hypothetical protein